MDPWGTDLIGFEYVRARYGSQRSSGSVHAYLMDPNIWTMNIHAFCSIIAFPIASLNIVTRCFCFRPRFWCDSDLCSLLAFVEWLPRCVTYYIYVYFLNALLVQEKCNVKQSVCGLEKPLLRRMRQETKRDFFLNWFWMQSRYS